MVSQPIQSQNKDLECRPTIGRVNFCRIELRYISRQIGLKTGRFYANRNVYMLDCFRDGSYSHFVQRFVLQSTQNSDVLSMKINMLLTWTKLIIHCQPNHKEIKMEGIRSLKFM